MARQMYKWRFTEHQILDKMWNGILSKWVTNTSSAWSPSYYSRLGPCYLGNMKNYNNNDILFSKHRRIIWAISSNIQCQKSALRVKVAQQRKESAKNIKQMGVIIKRGTGKQKEYWFKESIDMLIYLQWSRSCFGPLLAHSKKETGFQ